MLKVRRSLTEILLEVTNEEIDAVCREVWNRSRAKGTPDTHGRTNQLNFHIFARRCAKSGLVSLLVPCYNEVVRLCNTDLKTLNNDSLMHRLNYSVISGHPILCFQVFTCIIRHIFLVLIVIYINVNRFILHPV